MTGTPTPEWVFDPTPPSGALSGGDPASYVFNPDLDSLVREVVQNSTDQQKGEDPVEITFTLHELSAAARDDFLDALDWPRLRQHLEGVAGSQSLINGRVRDAIDRIDAGHLTMMTIEDKGTYGLTGPEEGTEGNFTALCKHVLVTTPKKAAGGGSYGLGKAVLWRFSSLSTVLFGSAFGEGGLRDARVFGRAELPFHDAEGQQWSGSGWFGQPETSHSGRRAVSVRGDVVRDLSNRLVLGREEPVRTGTTALILGFSEPGAERARPSAEIAQEVLAAASKWFWPRLLDRSLTVRAKSVVDGVPTFDEEAYADDADPFVIAASVTAGGEVAAKEGEIAQREIAVRVPGLRNEQPAEVEGHVTLRLFRTSDEDSSLKDERANTVALTRGAGMVVQYRRPRQTALLNGGFRAVLLAGTAHGTTDEDSAIEEFLRAAEPPAHDQWVHSTNKLASRYRPGAGARLQELFAKIDSTIVQMCDAAPPTGEAGPPLLAKLFRVGGTSGTTGAKHKFEVRFSQASFDGEEWSVEGKVVRTKGTRPWAVDVDASLEGVGSFKASLPVQSVFHSGTGIASQSVKDGELIRYIVPAETDELHFEITARPDPSDQALATESRFRVDARPHERTA